jgi:hypothetical protein
VLDADKGELLVSGMVLGECGKGQGKQGGEAAQAKRHGGFSCI